MAACSDAVDDGPDDKATRMELTMLMRAQGRQRLGIENNKEEATVKWAGLALKHASAELRADKEVVLADVARNGDALLYASAELRADKEVVLAAVGQAGGALKHASAELRSDKEVVLAAVARNGDALKYASADFKADSEVVLAAVAQNGRALRHASFSLQASGLRLYMAELLRAHRTMTSLLLCARPPRRTSDWPSDRPSPLSLLNAHGVHFATKFKRLITRFAGENLRILSPQALETIRLASASMELLGNFMPSCKLIITGDGGVGKSTFIKRHLTGEFERRYVATFPFEMHHEIIMHTSRGGLVFSTLEAAGSTMDVKCRYITDFEADCAIIMFDLTSRVTYKNIPSYYRALTRDRADTIPIVLVGSKVDCSGRRVKPKQITFHRKRGLPFVAMSTKHFFNFEAPFLWLSRALFRDEELRFVASPAPEPPPAPQASGADLERSERTFSEALRAPIPECEGEGFSLDEDPEGSGFASL